jgi:hypothetical protein
MAYSKSRCLRPIGSIGLGEDVSNVVSYCVEADEQVFCYVSVGLSHSNEAEHFHFTLTEAVWVAF